MSTQQHQVRRALDGLENVKLGRLKSATRNAKGMRGKPAFSVKTRGPAHHPEYTCYEVETRDGRGLSRWEVVARGDVADVQAALARILR